MEWINIKDCMPPENRNVILYDGNEVFCGGFDGYSRDQKPCFSNQVCDGVCYGWYEKKPITHWMELPEAPKV